MTRLRVKTWIVGRDNPSLAEILLHWEEAQQDGYKVELVRTSFYMLEMWVSK